MRDEIDVPDRAATPEAAASGEQLRQRLLAAIQDLPVGQRQAIVWTLEGLSQTEIADVLGITEGAVAVRVTRARQQLRQRMENLL
jgi:RNA polymerase sigma-70 factor (ECF subfamily)